MKEYHRILVSCIILLALAGSAAGAGFDAAVQAAHGWQNENTATCIAGDNSCPHCLQECHENYPPDEHPTANWFCRFSCWIGTCRVPPVY